MLWYVLGSTLIQAMFENSPVWYVFLFWRDWKLGFIGCNCTPKISNAWTNPVEARRFNVNRALVMSYRRLIDVETTSYVYSGKEFLKLERIYLKTNMTQPNRYLSVQSQQRSTWAICEVCSKCTLERPEWRQ